MSKTVKLDEHDLGQLTQLALKGGIQSEYGSKVLDGVFRDYWKGIPESYQRRLITDIEVYLELDRKGYDKYKLQYREIWEKFVLDLPPPKASYTVDYRCGKCKRDGLKLWRGVHGCADKDGNALLCAKCLAPDQEVGSDGKVWDAQLKIRHDQVNSWLPAVPVGDTFWGYTSVPSADCEWWYALPTYLYNG